MTNKPDEQPDKSNEEKQTVNPGYARERIRMGRVEIEVEGPPDYVERRMDKNLSQLGRPSVIPGWVKKTPSEQPELPGFEINDAPLLYENNGASENVSDSKNESHIHNLISFYTEKAPKSQPHQVLVIAYFYQKYKGYESLSLNDYAEAYDVLRRLAVDTPSNMKSSVRNVVDRTKYLYNPVRGQFGLTLLGEQLVESMPLSE